MRVLVSSMNLEEPPVDMDNVRTLVLRDNFGNPVFLAMQQADDVIWTLASGDRNFNKIVEELGISKRMAVKHTHAGG